LVDWDVQVRKDESQHEQFEARVSDAATGLAEALGLDPQLAEKLFRAGGATPELVEQMPLDYIAAAMEVEEEQAKEVLEKARTALGGGGAPAASAPPEEPGDEAVAESAGDEEPDAPVEEEESKASAATTEE
jgi:hypothetical protein